MASSHGKHEPNPQLWQKLFFLICIPAIGLSALNTYLIEKEHHEHYNRPEFKPYEYMRVRTKPFPWGDGQRSLFHNPKYNPLPDGWEELPEEEHKKH
jgi:cytochrome c oxidase subunit 6a